MGVVAGFFAGLIAALLMVLAALGGALDWLARDSDEDDSDGAADWMVTAPRKV